MLARASPEMQTDSKARAINCEAKRPEDQSPLTLRQRGRGREREETDSDREENSLHTTACYSSGHNTLSHVNAALCKNHKRVSMTSPRLADHRHDPRKLQSRSRFQIPSPIHPPCKFLIPSNFDPPIRRAEGLPLIIATLAGEKNEKRRKRGSNPEARIQIPLDGVV